MTPSFHDLGLAPDILDTLNELGYIEPTPIQAEAIPHLLAGRDVLGQAQTGTGKTAAFTLPTLQQMDLQGLQTLILTPTRELAIQVSEAVHRYGSKFGVRVLPIYGGQSYDRQIRRINKGVHVIVGTPGRTLDLIRQRMLKLNHVRFVILDEADEMLKMGFVEDVEEILRATDAEKRQTILFSATFSNEIRRLAHTYMHDPLHVAIEAQEVTVANVQQRYYVVQDSDKVAALCRLLEVEDLQNTLIFARTRAGAAELAETLAGRGYPAVAIHGDLAQNERERILRRFRNGQLTIMVATDVVARGVDIPEVSHVINFDIPQLAIEYVHRIGRTGRAGRGGDAITFISPRQRGHLRDIEEYTRKAISKAKLPSREDVIERRDEAFRAELMAQIEAYTSSEDNPALDSMIDELADMGLDARQVIAALIRMLRAQEAQRPLEEVRSVKELPERQQDSKPRKRNRNRDSNGREEGMVRLHMGIGKSNGVRPADVVYSVASAASIPGKVIGAIEIRQNETFVDVPEVHAEAVIRGTKSSKLRGRSMRLERA